MVTHFVQEDLPHLLEARRTNSSARGAHKTYLADKREW